MTMLLFVAMASVCWKTGFSRGSLVSLAAARAGVTQQQQQQQQQQQALLPIKKSIITLVH